MKNQRFVVSLGDPNGIGPAILLHYHRAHPQSSFVCVGDAASLRFWSEKTLISFDFPIIDTRIGYRPEPGKISAIAGEAAARAIEEGYKTAKAEKIPLVTLPVSKTAIGESRPGFTGHTELLAELDGKKPEDVVMLLGGEKMKVITLTRHIPLSSVSRELTFDSIVRQVTLAHEWFFRWKGRAPRIRIAGLNPHAGESGTIGTEEITVIVPAALYLQQQGIDIEGPIPADTLFVTGLRAGIDLFVGCYHDQALAPLKLVHFEDGVNATIGLSIIRTSPDHGTAFDIAEKGEPSIQSFETAVRWAQELHLAQK